MLIIGWWSSNPRTAATRLIYSVPLYLGLCATFSCPQMMSLVPLSPPSDIEPDTLPSKAICLRIFYLSYYFLISVRLPFSFTSTSSSAVCHPPSSRLKSTTFPLTAGRCHSDPSCLFNVPMFEGLPRLACAAGSTWFGSGWRGVGDGAPPNDVDVLDAYTY